MSGTQVKHLQLLHFMVAAYNQIHSIKYERRRPERKLLYRTLQTYWPVFLNEQRRVGKLLPLFIQDEFAKFLECGIPENGFIRTYCYQCQHSSVVPFSCKRRGFCPSCCAKRMNAEAAHLVDTVFPEVPYRQWVLSFPFKLRFIMARNQKLTNAALKIYLRAISSWQKKRAKGSGIINPQTGAVTFIQRFGSALNLNIHFHTLIPDGVFVETDAGYTFCRQSLPSHEELTHLAVKIHKKVLKYIATMGLMKTFKKALMKRGLVKFHHYPSRINRDLASEQAGDSPFWRKKYRGRSRR